MRPFRSRPGFGHHRSDAACSECGRMMVLLKLNRPADIRGADDGGAHTPGPQWLLAALAVVVALSAGAARAATPHRRGPLWLPGMRWGSAGDLRGGKTHATVSSHGVLLGQTNASFAMGQVVGTNAPFAGPIVSIARSADLIRNLVIRTPRGPQRSQAGKARCSARPGPTRHMTV
jgi:hypothetical protein